MTTPGILIVFSNQPYIGQIIFSNVFFIQDFQRPLVMNGMTGWKLNSKKLIRVRGKYTTNESGLIAIHGIITSVTIDNVISAKAYIPSGTDNIYTELYSYGTYAFIVIKDYNGNCIKNKEFDIVVFYIK